MTPEEQESLINELEKDIDRLQALYNQYFMGIEKIEPTVVRKNLDRKINRLRREQIKNTALRFRMQMQIQKYNTQSTYWSRICRQIEAGTYVRQVMLAKKRIERRHGPADTPSAVSETEILLSQKDLCADPPGSFELDMDAFNSDLGTLGIDLDDPFADASPRPAAPAPPSPAPTAAPYKPPPPQRRAPAPPPPARPAAAAPPPSLSREKAETIYRRYLAARKKCNEPTDNISFDCVSKSLNAKLRRDGGNMDFKVVIRSGKAVIKTVKTEAPSES